MMKKKKPETKMTTSKAERHKKFGKWYDRGFLESQWRDGQVKSLTMYPKGEIHEHEWVEQIICTKCGCTENKKAEQVKETFLCAWCDYSLPVKYFRSVVFGHPQVSETYLLNDKVVKIWSVSLNNKECEVIFESGQKSKTTIVSLQKPVPITVMEESK